MWAERWAKEERLNGGNGCFAVGLGTMNYML